MHPRLEEEGLRILTLQYQLVLLDSDSDESIVWTGSISRNKVGLVLRGLARLPTAY